jgi:hypothetical protein
MSAIYELEQLRLYRNQNYWINAGSGLFDETQAPAMNPMKPQPQQDLLRWEWELLEYAKLAEACFERLHSWEGDLESSLDYYDDEAEELYKERVAELDKKFEAVKKERAYIRKKKKELDSSPDERIREMMVIIADAKAQKKIVREGCQKLKAARAKFKADRMKFEDDMEDFRNVMRCRHNELDKEKEVVNSSRILAEKMRETYDLLLLEIRQREMDVTRREAAVGVSPSGPSGPARSQSRIEL